LRIETDPRIFTLSSTRVAFVSFGPDQQLPGPIMDGIMRSEHSGGVQDYLLKLDSVTCEKREVSGKLTSQNNPVSLKLTQ